MRGILGRQEKTLLSRIPLARENRKKMKIGVTIHATDRAMAPADVAREAEFRGFHSIYIPEHTHIPTSRRTPAPTGEAELAEEYKRSPDP